MVETRTATPQSIEYRCLTTANDYLRADRMFKFRDSVFWTIFVATTAVCFYGAYSALSALASGENAVGELMWFASYVAIYLGWCWSAFRFPKRAFEALPHVGTPFDVTIDGDGVFALGGGFAYGMYWKMFTRAVEGSDVIMLVSGKRGFHPLPKRCLSAQELEVVREQIRANISGAILLN